MTGEQVTVKAIGRRKVLRRRKIEKGVSFETKSSNFFANGAIESSTSASSISPLSVVLSFPRIRLKCLWKSPRDSRRPLWMSQIPTFSHVTGSLTERRFC